MRSVNGFMSLLCQRNALVTHGRIDGWLMTGKNMGLKINVSTYIKPASKIERGDPVSSRKDLEKKM